MNKKTVNQGKATNERPIKVAGPKPPHYNPRNTHLNKDGEVVVHGKVVCRPKGDHVRSGSYFTPKGTKPEPTPVSNTDLIHGIGSWNI